MSANMIKWSRILAVIFVCQIALTAVISKSSATLQPFSTEEKLLGLSFDALEKVVIEEREKPALTLGKAEQRWVLPDSSSFPVSPEKVSEVLKKLLEMKRSYPVAKTAIAAKQLKLTADNYEKKISFYAAGGQTKVLFLGSSPEYRRIHAKLADEDPIYAINLSSYEASTAPLEWYDKDLARINKDDLAKVDWPTFSLIDKEGKLTAADLKDQEAVNQEKLTEFLAKLTTISLIDFLGTEAKPEYKLDEPALRFTIQTKTGATIDYVFGGPLEDSYYVLKMSSLPFYLKLPKQMVEDLTRFNRETLVSVKTGV